MRHDFRYFGHLAAVFIVFKLSVYDNELLKMIFAFKCFYLFLLKKKKL